MEICLLNSLKRWSVRSSFSVSDQAIFAGANFALNLFLARWLSSSEYGAFAVAFSLFIFLSGFQNALILEPMSVIGPAKYLDNLFEYLWFLVRMSSFVGIAVFSTLILVSMTLKARESLLVPALLGLSLSSPFILLFWLFRRFWYLAARPEMALLTSVIYASTMLISLFIFHLKNWLTPFTGFVIVGLASMISTLLSWSLCRMIWKPGSFKKKSIDARIACKEHWHYGRWVVGSAFVYWLSGSVYVPLVGAFAGLDRAGAMRALQNLILPVTNIITGIDLLLLPWISSKRRELGNYHIRKYCFYISGLMVAMVVLYLILPIVGGRWLIRMLYPQSEYDKFIWIIPYLGIIALMNAAGEGFSLNLRAAESPNGLFWSHVGGATVTLTVGIILVRKLGLVGALWGNILSAFTGLLLIIYCWGRVFAKQLRER